MAGPRRATAVRWGDRDDPARRSEVLAIGLPPSEPRRGRLGLLGHPVTVGIVTVVALVVTAVGVVIAYLDWQENVRAGKAPAPSASPTPSPEPPPPSPTQRSVHRTRPPSTPAPTPSPSPSPSPDEELVTAQAVDPPVEDLSFELSAEQAGTNTVRIRPTASGRAKPGRSYWFMVETNWGNGNTDFFPRREVTSRTGAFEISIPPDADHRFVRQGRIYELTGAQSAKAEFMRQHQNTPRDDNFFPDAPETIASNVVTLPF